ncbi:MAG TPA: hypothetical protein VK593_06040 [Edaphobacter sp.]|nr:hypothetical protein [Edaphobacter sp.]
MTPAPETGQVVRHEGYDGKMIVKEVSADGRTVELIAMHGEPHTLNVPSSELLPGEDLSAG